MLSKSKLAINGTIQYPMGYGKAHKPKEFERLPVAGFDIEADYRTGEPCFLSFSHPKKVYTLEDFDAQAILDFFLSNFARYSICGAWNLSYDAEGLLTHAFPPAVTAPLIFNTEVNLDNDLCLCDPEDTVYKIRYIEGKRLSFSKNKVTTTLHDFAQYYGFRSLQQAAEEILGKSKDDFKADLTDGKKFREDDEYRNSLINYCIQDAKLCRELGDTFLTSLQKIFIPRRITTNAGIAEQYFRSKGYTIPNRFRGINHHYLPSYYGGRFEMLKRGYFENVKGYDIKSAYPYAMSKLKVVTDNFIQLGVRGYYNDTALYGAYTIIVDVDDRWNMGPVPVLLNSGTLIYPKGKIKTVVDKLTLEFLERHGFDFEIIKGYEIHDDNATQPLRKPIQDLFNGKSNKSLYVGIREAYKLIMNGGYGKTIELIDDVSSDVLPFSEDLIDNLPPGDILGISEYGVHVVGKGTAFKAGGMFCPAYASFITSHARLQLLEAAIKNPERVIAMHTDSIFGEELDITTSNELGGWELEKEGELEIIKCGFYRFTTNEGKSLIKARGAGKNADILSSIIPVKRRLSMRQAARRFDNTGANVISDKEMVNNLDTDSKRIWPADFGADMVIKKAYQDSKMLEVSDCDVWKP